MLPSNLEGMGSGNTVERVMEEEGLRQWSQRCQVLKGTRAVITSECMDIGALSELGVFRARYI